VIQLVSQTFLNLTVTPTPQVPFKSIDSTLQGKDGKSQQGLVEESKDLLFLCFLLQPIPKLSTTISSFRKKLPDIV